MTGESIRLFLVWHSESKVAIIRGYHRRGDQEETYYVD